jgi:hypothetical protein
LRHAVRYSSGVQGASSGSVPDFGDASLAPNYR